MTREEQLKFCNVCLNKSFDPKSGVICGLTGAPAQFEGNCPDFSEDEKEVRINERIQEDIKTVTEKSIDKGRIALFILGGLYLIVGIIEAFFMASSQIIFGVVDWILAAGFIGFAIWSYKNPYFALLAGLSLFLLVNVALAIFEPLTIFAGLLWKIIIIVYLIYAIITAKKDMDEKELSGEDKRISDLF